MISVHCLTERCGATRTGDKVTFQVLPEVPTGLVGFNGPEESTTPRVIIDLDVPTFGSTLIGGKPFPWFLLSRLSNHPPRCYSPTPPNREPTERFGRTAHLGPRLRRRACAL
jgi:ABC-type oligopeptide transport system ATPase subunit